MKKNLYKTVCIITSILVCTIIQSCRLFCEFCDEKYVQCYFHNSSSDTAYSYIEIRTDILKKPSVAHLRGDFEIDKLAPDSILDMKYVLADELEQTVFSFVVFSKKNYEEYTTDEIRENSIIDWGQAFNYDEMKKMDMMVEFRGFSE